MNSAVAKPVFKLTVCRDSLRPNQAEEAVDRPLEVSVLFTNMPATIRAMETAAELARGLNTHLRILVAQVVPYAVPLETPPVLVEFQEALFRDIVRVYGVETHVDIFLCRDADETLLQHLPPGSVVVLGTPKRWWWPTWEEKLARRLRRSGHEVIVVCGRKGNAHA